MKSALHNCLVVFGATVFALLLVELGSWVWVETVRGQQLSRWEFRATQPPPYQDADYFSQRFLGESETFVNGRLNDLVELNDYRGEYFNVSNGFRVTTDKPEGYTRRILLFGGSTLFGQEVPDRHTIASYLQRTLNDSGRAWKVLNYGLPGMNARQQVSILKKIPLRATDIIIFYHGVNDIYYVVFGGAPGGWTSGVPNFRPIQELNALAQWMSRWHDRLKGYSFTADVALDIFDRSVPETIANPDKLIEGAELAVVQFRAAVSEAYAHVARSDAEFVHFLQPTIFDVRERSEYEARLLTHYLETPPGVDIAFREGYPMLRDASFALSTDGIAFRDITDALDQRHAYGEIFLDFCHLNHTGNSLIADRIFEDYFKFRID